LLQNDLQLQESQEIPVKVYVDILF